MNRKQYAEMLRDIHETRVTGGDVSACIAGYCRRYKYAYFYNDAIFRLFFTNPSYMKWTVDFLNAAIKLEADECISDLTFVDPSLPGGPFNKSITSDLVAEDPEHNRIVLEIQHQDDTDFPDRIVYYTSKHTLANKVPGEVYKLRDLNFVVLQMFDVYSDSKRYRHEVCFRNEDGLRYFDKQTLTLIELKKFYDKGYLADNGPLAKWLRAIDHVNNENDGPLPGNPYVEVLQKYAKLSNFNVDFFLTEAKDMVDREYEIDIERRKARKEARAEGLAEGREEGRAEGREEGRAEGREEGRAEGREEGRLEERQKVEAELAEKEARIRELETLLAAKS